jgi:hypothetical protein
MTLLEPSGLQRGVNAELPKASLPSAPIHQTLQSQETDSCCAPVSTEHSGTAMGNQEIPKDFSGGRKDRAFAAKVRRR